MRPRPAAKHCSTRRGPKSRLIAGSARRASTTGQSYRAIVAPSVRAPSERPVSRPRTDRVITLEWRLSARQSLARVTFHLRRGPPWTGRDWASHPLNCSYVIRGRTVRPIVKHACVGDTVRSCYWIVEEVFATGNMLMKLKSDRVRDLLDNRHRHEVSGLVCSRNLRASQRVR
jgi:hypothetical protein